jgi:molybdopterin molybdotransferase
MVSFEMFVRPAVLKMMGHTKLDRPVVQAVMQDDYRKHDERRHYLRVALSQIAGKYQATLTGGQGSGILSSMTKADGLAVIAEDRISVQAGDDVPVILLD